MHVQVGTCARTEQLVRACVRACGGHCRCGPQGRVSALVPPTGVALAMGAKQPETLALVKVKQPGNMLQAVDGCCLARVEVVALAWRGVTGVGAPEMARGTRPTDATKANRITAARQPPRCRAALLGAAPWGGHANVAKTHTRAGAATELDLGSARAPSPSRQRQASQADARAARAAGPAKPESSQARAAKLGQQPPRPESTSMSAGRLGAMRCSPWGRAAHDLGPRGRSGSRHCYPTSTRRQLPVQLPRDKCPPRAPPRRPPPPPSSPGRSNMVRAAWRRTNGCPARCRQEGGRPTDLPWLLG